MCQYQIAKFMFPACVTYGGSGTSASTTTTATTATATTTSRRPLALTTFSTIGAFSSTGLIRLASELDRDLAFQDVLARQVLNGLLRLFGSFQIDKGISDRTVGTGVDGDGSRLSETNPLAMRRTTVGSGDIHIIA